MALNALHINYVKDVAKQHGIPAAFGLAVIDKESAGITLYKINGEDLPAIRIEGHHFYRRLSGKQRDEAVAQGLADPKVGGVKNPKTMAARYTMFKRMQAINSNAAFESVSYGLGQIMGFNYKNAGYRSARALFEASKSFYGQVDAMFNFIAADPVLLNAAKKLKFKAFAIGYNGKAAPKSYWEDLEKLYNAWAGKTGKVGDTAPNAAVIARIKDLGFNDVMSFQSSRSIKVDGIIGPVTREEVDKAEAEKKERLNAPIVAATKIGGAAIGVATSAAAIESPNIINDVVSAIAPITELVKTLAPMGAPVLYTGAGLVAVWAVYKGVTHWLSNRASNAAS